MSINIGKRLDGAVLLTVRGSWDEEIENAFLTGIWDVVSLFGVEWPNYELLLPYKEKIKWLSVPLGPDSSVGLDKLMFLEKLELNDFPKPIVDFKALTDLRHLSVLWSASRDASFLANKNLETLSVTNLGDKTLSVFSELLDLKKLSLMKGGLHNLVGIGELSSLKELNLNKVSKFTDFSELSKACGLEVIVGEGLKKITNIDAVRELPNLRCIQLDTPNAVISDLDWINNMPRLEKIMLSGQTQTIDWGIFAKHESLQSVAITAKEGYGVPDEEIFESLGVNGKKYKSYKRLSGKAPGFLIEW